MTGLGLRGLCSFPTNGSRGRDNERVIVNILLPGGPRNARKLHVRMHARVRANTCGCRPPFVAGLRDESCRCLRFRKRG
jgi:hypothetical protein